MQNIAQAKEYKRDLDAQKHLESFIKQEEKQNLRSDPSVLSKSQAKPFSYPNCYTSQSCFTKKYPKTIFYNPITGDLQDMSNFLNGKFPQKPFSESTDSLFLPVFKNNNKVAPVFSTLKAFQQPRYTKNHPKYVSSFPITGSNFSKDYSELRNSILRIRFRVFGLFFSICLSSSDSIRRIFKHSKSIRRYSPAKVWIRNHLAYSLLTSVFTMLVIIIQSHFAGNPRIWNGRRIQLSGSFKKCFTQTFSRLYSCYSPWADLFCLFVL